MIILSRSLLTICVISFALCVYLDIKMQKALSQKRGNSAQILVKYFSISLLVCCISRFFATLFEEMNTHSFSFLLSMLAKSFRDMFPLLVGGEIVLYLFDKNSKTPKL